ncbi:hypothetical protein ACLKA6_000439 [Drosophila palustris]
MDTTKTTKPKEAEQPPQSEVAVLSIMVEHMDAEDGLELDPYSPVSNSNTDEMEELLRVEEEILNSPPRAEPASKADKGDKVRLSGAVWKRLAHYRAKGVPLKQARVLAKQPMRKVERGSKAGSWKMSLPKRGSAKPGAGATPARVPVIEASSTDRKAAQPPIPRPTEATGTREHRSYSECASSNRFAVISKGFPTALLSTKELVMVREAILDEIREQRQRAVKPYFTGCSLRPDDLLKSQGYALCYGFGLVNVRPKNRYSVGVKGIAAEPGPGTASTTQVQEASQELPCRSNSIAPSSNTPDEEKEKTVGSTLEGSSTSTKAAEMERPATNAPQVARMHPPLYGRLPTKPGKGARRSQEETVLLGSNRDLVVVCAKVPTTGGEQEAVLASAYFPGDSSDAPSREVSALVEYCQDKRIGCDANDHNTVWGSIDVNKRALAWWTKVKQRKATAELSKLQRLVCVGIIGAMRTCPTDALGIITGISPLPILIEKEACRGALRLQGVANLNSGDLTGHLKILEIFFTSPIVHLSDVQLPMIIFNRNGMKIPTSCW